MHTFSTSALSAALISVLQQTHLVSDNDRAFVGRVYNGGNLDKYLVRLRGIGFVGLDRVLDAGCGFGQWTLALSELNARVVGTDIDQSRIEFAKNIKHNLGVTNIEFSDTSMDCKDLKSGDFDAVFSYNALALSPYRETLKQFHRILRPGGLLYFNGYDLGWMIHNIVEPQNPATDFDPRQWGIDSIQNTLCYFGGKGFSQNSPRDSMLMPKDLVMSDLLAMGFEIISICGDGMTCTFGDFGQQPFFPSEKYGLPAVYEVLCRKC